MDSAEPLVELAGQKRLAAILSVDLGLVIRPAANETRPTPCGPSTPWPHIVEQAARTHGGRVFNTAGDASCWNSPRFRAPWPPPPRSPRVRPRRFGVGGHLGEVTVTGTGDLLGHGVNVASRLQGMAKPGSVLVSDAFRRAVTGADGERFRRQGPGAARQDEPQRRGVHPST
ncbi:MAG: hypothetical protein WDN45_18765 [Caulobacteraceae bacterium]